MAKLQLITNPPASRPRLLVLDSSFSLEAIRSRGLEHSVTCRDLDGFFDHVWTVHPFASLVTSNAWAEKYGSPNIYSLAPRHTFIDGKVGRFSALRWFPPLNFLIGQLGIFWFLLRLIRHQGISLIRVGDPLYLGLFGWALGRVCRLPLVVRVGANHDKTYELTGRPLMRRLFLSRKFEKVAERFVFARADLVAGANQDNLDFALANNAKSEFSTLFRYGNLIDRRHFVEPATRGGGVALLHELGVGLQRFLLYVGRLEEIKHPDHVLRVLGILRRRGHDVRAVFAGDGALSGRLRDLSRTLGVEDRTILCGNQAQQWLSQILPHAAAVISPHTGRALSEAALAAAPIVAYDVDWQSELVQTGVTGELVPNLKWEEMAKATERFLADPDYARTMGRAARRRALEMLDPEALDQHEREQYAALLIRFAQRRGRPG
ncbi:MAG TPA: glycosyltransferase [Caulobacteraceae bacterium]